MIVIIFNSTNSGRVSGSQYVGGIIGQIVYGTNGSTIISNTINNGDITGSWDDVAGFVGYVSYFIDTYSMSYNIEYVSIK